MTGGIAAIALDHSEFKHLLESIECQKRLQTAAPNDPRRADLNKSESTWRNTIIGGGRRRKAQKGVEKGSRVEKREKERKNEVD